MKITVTTSKPNIKTDDALIVPLFKNEKLPKSLPKLVQEIGQGLQKRREFIGQEGEFKMILLPPAKKQKLSRAVIIGLGDQKDLSMKKYGQIIGAALRRLKNFKVKQIGLLVNKKVFSVFSDTQNIGETIAEYAVLANYDFTEYLKKKNPAVKSLNLYCSNKDLMPILKKGIQIGLIGANIVNESRDLANHPANIVSPKYLAQFVKDTVVKEKAIKLKILGEKEMKKLGMGAILGVARGSNQEARFIVLEYWGALKKNEAPYIFIGKGVTFDSGGISIKVAENMDEMKMDMAGGASVIGIIRSVAALCLPINAVGLIPACENMPGPQAFRPGDILKAKDGTTIEIINTDAEGRLLLADALVYARDYKPKVIVDLATLTGACQAALYDYASGLFTKNDQLAKELAEAGQNTGDMVWRLPLPDEYKGLIKSKVADVANLAFVRHGGAITAAVFLDYFVDDKYQWAHIDIAGTAWTKTGKKHLAPGATGAGIRLVVQWLRDNN